MSDTGTTAVPVSPSIPTESEMNGFRAMLDRALNAIVQASELAKTVEAMKADVEAFKADLEQARARNRDLDEMLGHVRGQRDEAERKLSQTQSELTQKSNECDSLHTQLGSQDTKIERLQVELESVKRDRDYAYEEWHKAQTAADSANADLDEFKSKAMDIFGLVAPTKPEPVQSAPVENAPSSQPANVPEAAPVEWVYEGDPAFNYARDYDWDNASGSYRQRKAS